MNLVTGPSSLLQLTMYSRYYQIKEQLSSKVNGDIKLDNFYQKQTVVQFSYKRYLQGERVINDVSKF